MGSRQAEERPGWPGTRMEAYLSQHYSPACRPPTSHSITATLRSAGQSLRFQARSSAPAIIIDSPLLHAPQIPSLLATRQRGNNARGRGRCVAARSFAATLPPALCLCSVLGDPIKPLQAQKEEIFCERGQQPSAGRARVQAGSPRSPGWSAWPPKTTSQDFPARRIPAAIRSSSK